MILEVLSPSTEGRDRFEKWIAYQRLSSLQEYVLVAQDSMEVEVYRRIEHGWEVERYHQHETIQLRSLEFDIAVEQIYEDVCSSETALSEAGASISQSQPSSPENA